MRRNYYEIEELAECIIDELNNDYEFYVLLDDNYKVDFNFRYKFYDTEKIFIKGWCDWYGIDEVIVYELEINNIFNTRKEFYDRVKSIKRDILKDLNDREYIIIIPQKKGILKRNLNYKSKFYNYALQKI